MSGESVVSIVIRFRDWWLGQLRGQRGLGRVVWVGVPVLFSCCICSLALVMVAPTPDVEPTAAVVERAVATVEVAEVEQTAVPATVEPTVEPTTAPPTATRAATRTPAPTATDEPTRPPVRAATALAETVVADQLTVTAAAPSATAVPPTATRPAATATSVPLPTAAPTSVPPTATVVRAATIALPTTTAAPLPTATQPAAAAAGDVFISSVRYDGDVPQVESDEYAVITNRGGSVVNLNGWRLNAGEPDQNFFFPSFDLQPGQSCRVYTDEAHPESCGFSFGRGDAIWRNSGDCGYLFNAEGAEVSRYCWN